MTISHLRYTQKVPFLYTERACVVFSSFEIHPGRFSVLKKVLQVSWTRGSSLVGVVKVVLVQVWPILPL